MASSAPRNPASGSTADFPAMRAVTQDQYGTSEILQLSEMPRPGVGDEQVLIKVQAAGLDRGTEHLLTGKPYAMRLGSGMRRPKNPVPGRDVAGTVVQVGAKVTRFTVGDEVYGIAPGSFAEYAVTGEDKLALKPSNLSFAEASVVPISAGTALQALTDAGKLEAGQSVLVTGASGGVGSYAVQLARILGAEVTGVCSTAKLDYVRQLGAHHVIDYSNSDWADGTRRYDLILDIAGNPPIKRLRRALATRGTVVFVGGEGGGAVTGMSRQMGGALMSAVLKQRMVLFLGRERAAVYEQLSRFIESGELVPSLDRTFPLPEAREAMQMLERGEIRGKVAITV